MNSVEAEARHGSSETLALPAQAYPLGRWTMFKNPFVRRSKPIAPAAPVQGELLLDLVRPIRNDLSDADLEVVAPGTGPRSQTFQPSAPVPGPEPAAPVDRSVSSSTAPAAWSRVKDEFLEAGKT